jgi:hypothetical protein
MKGRAMMWIVQLFHLKWEDFEKELLIGTKSTNLFIV